MIGPLNRKVIKNIKGLEISYGLMKIGHKILIVNPIGMFFVEIPGHTQNFKRIYLSISQAFHNHTEKVMCLIYQALVFKGLKF